MTKPQVEVPKGLIIDQDEYSAALRTIEAHRIAKSLGVKLPYSLAKKFHCRCGEVYVLPKKFLAHRSLCKVLLRDKDLLDRRPVEKVEVIKVKEKKKQVYECMGCGYEFHNKSHLTHHKKICHSYSEFEEVVTRGKDYLERHKVKRGKRI